MQQNFWTFLHLLSFFLIISLFRQIVLPREHFPAGRYSPEFIALIIIIYSFVIKCMISERRKVIVNWTRIGIFTIRFVFCGTDFVGMHLILFLSVWIGLKISSYPKMLCFSEDWLAGSLISLSCRWSDIYCRRLKWQILDPKIFVKNKFSKFRQMPVCQFICRRSVSDILDRQCRPMLAAKLFQMQKISISRKKNMRKLERREHNWFHISLLNFIRLRYSLHEDLF